MRYWLRRVGRSKIRNCFASSIAKATFGASSQIAFLIESFSLSPMTHFTFTQFFTAQDTIAAG
jgi:hypothetical protein